MKKEKECVGQCYICKVNLYRSENIDWVYADKRLVCKKHSGVEQWYQEEIDLLNKQL